MATQDIVVVGASAGGVEAISRLVAELPRDLRASVLVVLHVSRGRSVFPEILTRTGMLPARHAADGEPLRYGRIYVAPPDHHMIVEGDAVRVVHGPSENGVRPAVDPLFRSAARRYGSRVIGIVLTGALDDGTAGLAAVKEAGGITIVQNPAEAFAPSMPRSAIEFVAVDHVLPLADIPLLVTALTRESVPADRPSAPADSPAAGPHLLQMEADLGEVPTAERSRDRPGEVSVFTCPECNGTLWERGAGGILRFRCRVGHAFTASSMLAAQTDSVDRALWAGLRALEERAALARRLAARARARGQAGVARTFTTRAERAEEQAAIVKDIVLSRSSMHLVPDEAVSGAELAGAEAAGSPEMPRAD